MGRDTEVGRRDGPCRTPRGIAESIDGRRLTHGSSTRLRRHVALAWALPELGDRKLADVDLADLLELKEQLLGEGVDGSMLHNVRPVEGDLPRARVAGRVPVNPTTGLELPTAGRCDRAASPAQVAELLAAFPELIRDRAGYLTVNSRSTSEQSASGGRNTVRSTSNAPDQHVTAHRPSRSRSSCRFVMTAASASGRVERAVLGELRSFAELGDEAADVAVQPTPDRLDHVGGRGS